jgi:signal peptidase II
LSPRLWGLVVAVAVVVADQVAKAAATRALDGVEMPAGPFLNLALARNTGISFSLFAGAPSGRWVLLAFTLVASLAILIWLLRTRTLLSSVAIGLILGGALGNGCDRLVNGSVTDFLDLHFGAWHPFVFNLADAAISLGVAGLLWEGLTDRGSHAPADKTAA